MIPGEYSDGPPEGGYALPRLGNVAFARRFPARAGTFAARALDRGASSPIPARLHFPPVRPGVGADDPTSCADHPRAEGADENGVAPLVCAEHSLVGALFLSTLDIHMSKRARPAIPMADLIVSFALMGIAISPT